MNFYIVDDDPSIPMILTQILEQNANNTVVGTAGDAKQALPEVMMLNIDIVLVDLLMPEISGIDLIKRLKQLKSQLRFVMISQVRDSELRAQAYEAGIEFFIDKPINVIEVKTVIEKVTQNIQMATKLNDIQSLVGGVSTPKPAIQRYDTEKAKILSILRFLGITSEAGSSDILAISQIMLEQDIAFRDIDFNSQYHIDEHEKKILFQRIRRAIKTGLSNLANLLLDDMGDELVVEYANTLFDYKNVRSEAQFLQDERATGGKTSLKHFFEGLVQESQS